MRTILSLLLISVFLAIPAMAEDAEATAALYQVSDVAVDTTADNASHARDRAVIEAQRKAFEQLMGRLGADGALVAKQSDDAIASFVQAFEVQQERTSAVRYIGTFTVQFKPNAVRSFINKNGANYNEMRSKPVLVLPVETFGGRSILWEEATKWRAAWEDAARGASTVPLVIPAGGLDDIAIVSTNEAVSGKSEALQAMARKYMASSVLIANLKADPDHIDPKQGFEIETVRYDLNGKTGEPVHYTPAVPTDSSSTRGVMTQVVRQIRSELENDWKQTAKTVKGTSMHLPVTVHIEGLPMWNDIKRKLAMTTNINKLSVIALTRSAAKIELEFYGSIDELKNALTQQGLQLEQTGADGAWFLRVGSTS